MRKIIIFGNSSSGKSTLAKQLCKEGLVHLDLDTIAWDNTCPMPERRALAESAVILEQFTESHQSWVIEGCYADLLALVAESASDAIFMDLSVEQCIQNAMRRPWEPHKYASKQAQDENLAMLIQWIAQYPERSDAFSYLSHKVLYDNFKGTKTRIQVNS